jgi:hypothetical protein
MAIASEGDGEIDEHANVVIRTPRCREFFSPLLAVIPLQLFAYHMGVRRGRDVDKPRNPAKSVTVECALERRAYAPGMNPGQAIRPYVTLRGSGSAMLLAPAGVA